MKLVDYTRQPKTPGFLQQVIDNLPIWLPFLYSEKFAHDRFVTRLQRGLDNRFFLLKNLPLGNSPDLSPYLLIGPPGLVILNVSTNLIRQSLELEQRLGAFLERQSFNCPAIQSVLQFIDPGVHVETSRPAVRIVLVDGIKNLAANLVQADEVMPGGQIRALVDLLDRSARPEQVQNLLGEGEDFFGKDLIQPAPKVAASPKKPLPVPQLDLPPVMEKMGLSRGQWIAVAALAVITILALAGLTVYLLLIV